MLHLSTRFVKCSGHFMLHLSTHSCSVVAISMLHLSTRFVKCSGHLYAASGHTFYVVQWPFLKCISSCVSSSVVLSLHYICPHVSCNSVATFMLYLSTCCMQCSDHLYGASVHTFHAVIVAISVVPVSIYFIQFSCHLYGASVHVFHAVQWACLWSLSPYIPCSAVAICMVSVSLYSIECSCIFTVPLSLFSLQCSGDKTSLDINVSYFDPFCPHPYDLS